MSTQSRSEIAAGIGRAIVKRCRQFFVSHVRVFEGQFKQGSHAGAVETKVAVEVDSHEIVF